MNTMRTTKGRLILLACLSLATFSTFAETLYVGDMLRIGVRADTSSDAASLSVITTGAQVEVIQQKGNLTRIRTENGVEGWVKSAYLTDKKPAALLLREATEKLKKLEIDISNAKNRQSQGGIAMPKDALEQIEQLENEKTHLLEELESLRNESGNENARASLIEIGSDLNTIYWLLGSLVVILALGFLFGVTWHKHQVMKRLGGLRL